MTTQVAVYLLKWNNLQSQNDIFCGHIGRRLPTASGKSLLRSLSKENRFLLSCFWRLARNMRQGRAGIQNQQDTTEINHDLFRLFQTTLVELKTHNYSLEDQCRKQRSGEYGQNLRPQNHPTVRGCNGISDIDALSYIMQMQLCLCHVVSFLLSWLVQ